MSIPFHEWSLVRPIPHRRGVTADHGSTFAQLFRVEALEDRDLQAKQRNRCYKSREMRNVFSIDVEDWFNISGRGEPDPSTWDSLSGTVERNFRSFLEVFAEERVQVTCFFLGYVAKRYPHLVTEALKAGHEIASHSSLHKLVFNQDRAAFTADVKASRELLEDLTGKAVTGFRAPAFSANASTPWFFEALVEAGYKYDSSVFPASHDLGGGLSDKLGPHVVRTSAGDLDEYPISVAKVLGKARCFFGGGYLRLYPYAVIRKTAERVLSDGRPLIFYIHPREIDPSHPRIEMPWRGRLKTYVNLATTEPKVRRILRDFAPTSFEQIRASGNLTGYSESAGPSRLAS
jgi:polysaccharide deacetylase family protein (PEP-CTERM system associated)